MYKKMSLYFFVGEDFCEKLPQTPPKKQPLAKVKEEKKNTPLGIKRQPIPKGVSESYIIKI